MFISFDRWRFICVYFLLSTLAPSLALAIDPNRIPPAQIFLLRNKIKNKECTATIFKPSANSCALVTNAHCIGAQVPKVEIVEMYHRQLSLSLYRPEVDKKLDVLDRFEVEVLKVSAEMDLAELKIPSALEKFYCQRLLPSVAVDLPTLVRSEHGLLSLGYVNQTPYSTASGRFQTGLSGTGQTLIWPDVGYSQRSVFETQIPELPAVIQVEDFRIVRGMSGGPVIDQYKNFVGLNVWLRDQGIEQSFFIPVVSILQFLKNPYPALLKAETSSSRLQDKLDPAGANGRMGSGGNGHSDGGGNGHSDGGGTGVDRIDRWQGTRQHFIKELSEFFFRPEGVIDPKSPQELILGINQQSVDGQDDLVRLQRQKIEEVVQKQNHPLSYPSRSVREGLLQRLAGNYLAPNDAARTNIYLYSNRNRDFEKSLDYTGSPSIRLSIDPVRNELKFVIGSHPLLHRSRLSQVDPIDEVLGIFRTEFINEGRQVVLVAGAAPSNEIRLLCDNDQYLKLNCEGRGLMLSLHLVRPGQMEIVFAAKASNNAFLMHIYGKLNKN